MENRVYEFTHNSGNTFAREGAGLIDALLNLNTYLTEEYGTMDGGQYFRETASAERVLKADDKQVLKAILPVDYKDGTIVSIKTGQTIIKAEREAGKTPISGWQRDLLLQIICDYLNSQRFNI